MVGMVLVLIAVVVVALGAVLAFLRLRPRGGDLDSVRSYHSALGTREHHNDRVGPSGVTVVGPGDPTDGGRVRPRQGPGGVGSASVPPVPVLGNDDFPDPGTPLVFDDARPGDRVPARSTADGAGPARMDRAQRHALDSMNHRPRRTTTVVVAAVVVVLFAGLAYSGSRHHAARTATTSPPPSTSGAGTHPARSTSPTTVARSGRTHGTSPGHRRTGGSTTTTTAPSQIVAVSTSGASATYQVASASYRLSLSATGQCWVLARSVATGATLWTGTLQAGTNQLIPATGAVTLELGAPSVALTVDRVPVVFPTPFHTPFVATFEPAPTAAPAGSTTTTTASVVSGGAGTTGG